MNGNKHMLFGDDIHRVEALTDGVFAIVMTLMVFNISLPKNEPTTDLRQELWKLWPSFMAYLIAFGMAGIYWAANHNMFHFIKRSSHEFIWLTILFLACVSVLPFSTGLLARFHTNVIALVFFGLNLECIGLSLFWILCHSTTSRRLTDPDLPEAVIRYAKSRIVTGIVGYGIATAAAFFNTTVALTLFLLIPLLFVLPPIQRLWTGKYGVRYSSDQNVRSERGSERSG